MSVEISISNRLKETLEKIEKGEICSAYIQENIKSTYEKGKARWDFIGHEFVFHKEQNIGETISANLTV